MLDPTAVADVMSDVVPWWGVSGGWAIDLWRGVQSREHHDIEIVDRRCDQQILHRALSGKWKLSCIDPPGSDWRVCNGDLIDTHAFQLQARSDRREFDLFTETVEQGIWTFRRDDRIGMPASEVVVGSLKGIPVVRPEVQLLYMATSKAIKNQHDFEIAQRHLSTDAAAWLARSLAATQPGHRWIAALHTRIEPPTDIQ